jgi:hypothetical protein
MPGDSPTSPNPSGHRAGRRRIVAIAAAVIVVGVVALAALSYVPVSHSQSEYVRMPINLPFNYAIPECTNSTFGVSGSFSFSVKLPNGDPIYLTIIGPTNAQLYKGLGVSLITGQIGVDPGGAVYEFCLSTPTYSDPADLGIATLDGNVTYQTLSPIL